MSANPGPVGAPNRRDWPTVDSIWPGDHVKVGERWERVAATTQRAGLVAVQTETSLLIGHPRACIHAVRTDRDRDRDGWRACPQCGKRHDRDGRYCSDACRDEHFGQLLATREDVRRWIADGWKALA